MVWNVSEKGAEFLRELFDSEEDLFDFVADFARVRDKVDGIQGDGVTNHHDHIAHSHSRRREPVIASKPARPFKGEFQYMNDTMVSQNQAGADYSRACPPLP